MIRERIIIDTDPGVDDALAIAMAIGAGLEIEALCTVFGNASVDDTTNNALTIQYLLGKNMKVYKGSGSPIKGKSKFATAHGKGGFGGISLRTRLKAERWSALDFYINFLDLQQDDSTTIICIGPLTNIANVFMKNVKLIKKIKEIVILTGVFGEKGNISDFAEFNAYNDPYSLKFVLGLSVKKILIPANVCRKIVFNEYVFTKVRGDLTNRMKEVINEYINYYKNDYKFGGYRGGVMYDLLAISYLLQPKAFKVEEACVEVVLDGNHRGQTIVVEGMKNCELALNVQSRDIENL
ncbi:MAG TPA: nucleoside hydrolase, partial [Candidatus Woesebacteria bacterium]|nr:nucleoside hydrolase [Candidatus Woesebacteria bacterium]